MVWGIDERTRRCRNRDNDIDVPTAWQWTGWYIANRGLCNRYWLVYDGGLLKKGGDKK
ncbi:MAG: hypothetical protein KAS87_06470 [Candidatus Omnitrophica bacterium]|nr:hypothetical protein [Candidatus Omnitrophota bacterium]